MISSTTAVTEASFASIKVWQVPQPVPPSMHNYKYRLAYVYESVRVIGYDNERGKGDHRHYNGVESPYLFKDVDAPLADFWKDVDGWRPK